MKLSIAVSSLLLTTSNTLAFGPAPSRSHAVTDSGLLSTTAAKSQTEAQQTHSMDFSQFPRRGYLQGATPIEEMKNLSKALGGEVNLYVKRDDLLPGACGGNKTRKLDFCIAEALASGAGTIVTCGAVQSNHCRLTAAWCAKEGID